MPTCSHAPAVKLPVRTWHIVLLLVLLLPFFIAAWYTFPLGDDFSRSNKAGYLFDVWGGIKEMLRAFDRWSGRYTHHFIIVFLGKAAYYRFTYGLLVTVFMALHPVALYGIFKNLAPSQSTREHIFLALFTFTSLLCLYRPLGLPWYVLTDIFGLGLARLTTLFYIWALLAVWNAPVLSKSLRRWSIFSVIVMVGTYEYATFMAPICTVTAYWLAKKNDHPHVAFFRLLTIVTAVCFVVSFFAPGNFRRGTKRWPGWLMILEQLQSAISDWWTGIVPVLLSPFMVSLGVVALWLRPSTRHGLQRWVPSPGFIVCAAVVLASLLTLAVVLLHAFTTVAVLGSSKVAPALMVYVACMVFFAMVYARMRWVGRLPRWSFTPLFLVACLPLFLTPNFTGSTAGLLFGATQRFGVFNEQREQVAQQHAGEDILFPPLLECPEPSCMGEVLHVAPERWPNKHFAPFHGIASAGLQAPALPPSILKGDAVPAWWVLPTEQAQPIALALAPSVASGPNEAFRLDWLLARFNTGAADLNLVVLPVSDHSPAASIAPLLGAELPARFTLPHWFTGNLGAMRFGPEHLLPAANGTPEMHYTALPLQSSAAGPLRAVYVSRDGKVFYRMDLNAATTGAALTQ